MPTIGAMLMRGFMRTAVVRRRTGIWIFFGNLDAMFLDLTIRALMMQVTIVKVVRMAIMLHWSMSTVWAMLMFVIIVQMRHDRISLIYFAFLVCNIHVSQSPLSLKHL